MGKSWVKGWGKTGKFDHLANRPWADRLFQQIPSLRLSFSLDISRIASDDIPFHTVVQLLLGGFLNIL